MTPRWAQLPSHHRCRVRAEAVDARLHALCPHGMSLVALGGYGRGTLAPYSDIDLLILHAEPLGMAGEEAIRRLLHTLWDEGFRIGYAVRTVEETIALARRDHPTFSSLLDHRPVAGAAHLYETLAEGVARLLQHEGRRFCEEKLEELSVRHARFRQKAPDVLKSPGGLRDLQTLCWLETAGGLAPHFTAAEVAALTHHHHRLWEHRCARHETAGSKDDGVEEKDLAGAMENMWQRVLAPRVEEARLVLAAGEGQPGDGAAEFLLRGA